MKPLVSIIVLNFNGEKWLVKCLPTILDQDYSNTEVIVVDNHSTDNSLEFLNKYRSKIKIHQNLENLGYAGGMNSGLKLSGGEFVLFLNNDITLEKGFISKLLKAFDEIPTLGVVQSKIVQMDHPDILDNCGAFWTSTTFLYYYGNSKSEKLPQYNQSRPVFMVKGVAIMVKKSVIEKIGLFDADFWCYYEEGDLCHRAWLSGYECWYYPEAVVDHAGGGTSLRFDNSFIQFHNFKNKLLSFLKNFELKNLLWILPVFVSLNILLSVIWLFQGKTKHSVSLYKAFLWNIVHLHSTIKKRQQVQLLRKKSDREIFKICKKDPGLSFYYYLLTSQMEKYQDAKI